MDPTLPAKKGRGRREGLKVCASLPPSDGRKTPSLSTFYLGHNAICGATPLPHFSHRTTTAEKEKSNSSRKVPSLRYTVESKDPRCRLQEVSLPPSLPGMTPSSLLDPSCLHPLSGSAQFSSSSPLSSSPPPPPTLAGSNFYGLLFPPSLLIPYSFSPGQAGKSSRSAYSEVFQIPKQDKIDILYVV